MSTSAVMRLNDLNRGSPVQVRPWDSDYFRERYMTAVRLSPR